VFEFCVAVCASAALMPKQVLNVRLIVGFYQFLSGKVVSEAVHVNLKESWVFLYVCKFAPKIDKIVSCIAAVRVKDVFAVFSARYSILIQKREKEGYVGHGIILKTNEATSLHI
jgi:hypothetical protein